MNNLILNEKNYSIYVLEELYKIENFSNEYKSELRLLSKKIRKDMWKDGNDEVLYIMLRSINKVYKWVYIDYNLFDLGVIIQYVIHLKKYKEYLNIKLDNLYYEKLIDDIRIENARKIVIKQWKDINNSENGLQTFISVFDDVFKTCMNKNRGAFFHELKSTDVICRVVEGWGHNTDRFIPWPNKTQNRWNPPGKTYLYLSFSKKNEEYSDELSLNEYICLEEVRAVNGGKYMSCKFTPNMGGNILDLSYNDILLGQLNYEVDAYISRLTEDFKTDVLSDQNIIRKYANHPKEMEEFIRSRQKSFQVNNDFISDSYAKQYLKLICSCIYDKVDEKDEAKLGEIYKSFHILSEYLEKNGITGIIYPCTRTKKVIGKNLVLFNIEDARPVGDTLRNISY